MRSAMPSGMEGNSPSSEMGGAQPMLSMLLPNSLDDLSRTPFLASRCPYHRHLNPDVHRKRLRIPRSTGGGTCLVPSQETDRIQEAHITIGHILCQIVDQTLFPIGFVRS